jgi:hypothetical protein
MWKLCRAKDKLPPPLDTFATAVDAGALIRIQRQRQAEVEAAESSRTAKIVKGQTAESPGRTHRSECKAAAAVAEWQGTIFEQIGPLIAVYLRAMRKTGKAGKNNVTGLIGGAGGIDLLTQTGSCGCDLFKVAIDEPTLLHKFVGHLKSCRSEIIAVLHGLGKTKEGVALQQPEIMALWAPEIKLLSEGEQHEAMVSRLAATLRYTRP